METVGNMSEAVQPGNCKQGQDMAPRDTKHDSNQKSSKKSGKDSLNLELTPHQDTPPSSNAVKTTGPHNSPTETAGQPTNGSNAKNTNRRSPLKSKSSENIDNIESHQSSEKQSPLKSSSSGNIAQITSSEKNNTHSKRSSLQDSPVKKSSGQNGSPLKSPSSGNIGESKNPIKKSPESGSTEGSPVKQENHVNQDSSVKQDSPKKLHDSPKKQEDSITQESAIKQASPLKDESEMKRSDGSSEPDESKSMKKSSEKVLDVTDVEIESISLGQSESPVNDEEQPKSAAFTGRSTLPRSNTLSTGLGSEAGTDDDDTINVVVRVRPLNVNENSRKDRNVMQFPGDGAIWIDTGTTTKSFTFNVTFEPEASQEDVFEHSGIKKLIEMALNGYSCTAFAFGQTGSGKTHTITGPPELGKLDPTSQGLIPRAFHYLFKLMNQTKNMGYRITASYLEIYNEQVIDLLNPTQGRQLIVRWSKNKGFYVENLFVIDCETMDDVMAVLEEGLRNRQTGSNSMNEHSSRSHSMLTLQIDSEAPDPDDENLFITKHGKLTFVDLAGSEKVKNEVGATAGHITESNNINKSLLVLGNCIAALGDAKRKTGHIPYRDSKLTKLLADSLGGNGVTLMIACVSPSSCNSFESLNTLRYANRAKKIKTKPVVKMDPREKLILSLKREIKVLRQENHYLRQQLEFPVKPRGQLQKENDAKFLQMLKEQETTGTVTVTDHGLYEMLQEYMIENETLRNENSDLHQMKDQSRRDQQFLARENEKLMRKIDAMERERYYANTPVSIYSVNSSRHGSATDHNMYYNGKPSHGTPPSWPSQEQLSRNSTSDSWHSYNKPTSHDGHTPRSSKDGYVVPPPGAGSMKISPPGGMHQPKKPPHRLAEPIKSPRYDGPPGGGYAAKYQQQQLASPGETHSSPRLGGGPITSPPGRGPPPGYQRPPQQYSQQPQQQYSQQPQQHQYSRQEQPLPQPRRSKGSQGSGHSSVSIPSDNGSATLSTNESTQEMNERLKQELLELEGEIHNQARQIQPKHSMNAR